MNRKLLYVPLLLCLFILANASPGVAREKVDDDVIAGLLEEGWTILGDGVLRRELRAGEVEHFVFGAKGFTWKLQDLRLQYRRLLDAYQLTPTPELKRTIANHRKEINSTMQMIRRARAAEKQGLEDDLKVDCTVRWGYNAAAGHKTDVQGIWANASAYFNGTCGFIGEVYAYATATVTRAAGPYNESVTDGPRSGPNVSASAAVNIWGGPPCSSYSYGSMTSNNLNPSSYSMAASHDQCPQVTPPTCSIIGPSTVDLRTLTCKSTTWSAGISGGTSPYSVTWTVDGVTQVSGSSFTMNVCRGWGGGFTLAIRVVDSLGLVCNASFYITVFEPIVCEDPCLCASPTDAVPIPCY